MTTTALAKLGKNEPVNLEILLKCDISDIMEIEETEK